MTVSTPHDEPIPSRLNLVLCVAAWALAVALLIGASRTESTLLLLAFAIAFSFVGNTIFSLLHESVHGIAHPQRIINETLGIVCAAFFPTGLSLQRVSHLGHHRRNRTEVETFDYYYPEDSRVLKTIQWYGIISGIYWFVVVLGWLLYLFVPFVFSIRLVRSSKSLVFEHASGGAYIRGFDAAPALRARVELLFTLLLQASLFVVFDVSLLAWLACYTAFAINWSALQYADHAFSPLDITDGAWDLRVPTWVRMIFLNYHLHLAHHRRPSTPWIYLPRYVDNSRFRPSFLRHFLEMWRGPRPAPGPPARAGLQ